MMHIGDTASQLASQVAKHTEQEITKQLNDFISRGLIEIETMGPTFVEVRREGKFEIEVRHAVRLVLKDKEYIEQLEKENAKLKEILGFKNEMENLRK